MMRSSRPKNDTVQLSCWRLCLNFSLILLFTVATYGQTNPLRTSESTQAAPLRPEEPPQEKPVAKSEVKAKTVDGHVTLANGDRIPARTTRFSDDQIVFGSNLFDETVKLGADSLRSFGSHPSAESKDTEQGLQFRFRLKSGTALYGQLVSLSETECVLESRYFGQVSIPLENLVEINQSVRQLDTTVYTSLNWQRLGIQNGPDAQGRISLPADTKAPLVLPERLDGSGRIRIDFLCGTKTEFQIRLVNTNHTKVVGIGVAYQSLVVESDGELVFGEFDVHHGAKRLIIDWNGEAINVLNELGRSLVNVELNSKTPLSVAIENDGSDLKIDQVSTGSVNPPITNADVSMDQMLLKRLEDDWAPAKKIAADSSAVMFEGQHGPEEIKVEQLERIWFGGQTNKTELTDEWAPDAQPTSRPATGYACLWRQGQRAVFQQLDWQDGKMSFTTDEFESQNFLSDNFPAEIFLPKKTLSPDSTVTPTDKTTGQEYHLAISGIPFSGLHFDGDIIHPVRWQFFGFAEPVSLNIQRRIEIRRKRLPRTPRDKDSPDRLLLSDGSIVPCRIGVASGENLSFESKYVVAKRIPLNEVRCCFFNSSNVRWKATLTNETVQRALTLPRFADGLPFTHVLIGKNGDLLRGDLIRIGEDEIGFESRFQPLLIKRKSVVGIVAVSADPIGNLSDVEASSAAKAKAAATEKTEDSPEKVTMHVNCGDDFVAVGQYELLSREKAVVNSGLLGKLELDAAGIRQIAFNSRFRDVSALQYFTDWQINSSIEPRWEAESEFAADSNELFNQPAPDFALPMLSESDVFQLSSHQGKLVVINFWESTSKPSVLGMPEYWNVIQKFSPQDVVFVAPNQGETVSTVRKFLGEKKWSSLDIAMDANKEASSKFKVTGIPHLTILDRSGVVRFIQVGYSRQSAAELENQLRELLNE